MALNLGDINFGLGVDTRRLSTSVRDVIKFGQSVTIASSASSAASKKTAAALRKQERAALSALQQTLRFNESVRKSEGPTRLLTSSARAFKEYTNAVARGEVSTLSFQRAQSKFQADMQRSQRSLQRFKNSLDPKPVNGFSDALRNLSSASVLAVGPLSGIGARITALTSIAGRTNLAMVGLIAGFTTAGVVLGKFSAGAIRTAIEMDKVDARLEAVTGSTEGAAEAFARIQQLSDDTGTELIGVANAYAKITAASAGTALEGAKVDQVFEDVLFGAAKFRIGTEELNGVLKAFEQIMSKGIVQSEELRGQLGDRLVGAFNIAAQSMGVTTQELNKMLKAGKVMSDEFLPEFAAAFRRAVGAEQTRRVEGLQASMNRLKNSQTAFNSAFDETFNISKLFEGAVLSLTSVTTFFANNMDMLAKVSAAATGSLLALSGGKIISGFVVLVGWIVKASGAMLGLNAAVLANPIGGIATILTRLGVALVGAVAGFGLVSVAMGSTDDKQAQLIDTVDAYIDAQNAAQTTAIETTDVMLREVERQMQGLRENMFNERMQLQAPEFERFETQSDLNLGLRFQDRDAERFVALMDQLKISEAEAGVEMAGLVSKYNELLAIQGDQKAAIDAKAAAEKAAISNTEADAAAQIARIGQEVIALNTSTQSLQALKAEFAQTATIDKFRDTLAKAGVDAGRSAALIVQFAYAVSELAEAQQNQVLKETADQIARIRQEAEATSEGTDALQALQDAFSQTDSVTQFRNQLVAAGIDLNTVEQQTMEFRDALNALNEATTQQNMAVAISEVTNEIFKMNAEAAAIGNGTDAVRRLEEQFGQNQQIDAFRQKLEAAGVSGSQLAAIMGTLTSAIFNLNNAAASARVDTALQGAGDAVALIRRETEALAGGEDAFKAFQNARTVETSVDNLRESLTEAGVAESDIALRVGEHQTAMEGLIGARTSYQALLAANKGGGGGGSDSDDKELKRLMELTAALDNMQSVVALGSDAFATLHSNMAIAERVEEYRASLVRAGMSQDEVNTKVEAFRNAATAYDASKTSVEGMTEALQTASGLLSGVIEKSLTLSTINPLDLRHGMEAAESIAQYRMALEALGVAQEEVTAKVDAFRNKLIEVSSQEDALRNVESIFNSVTESIAGGFDSLADATARALVTGEGDLSALADIGEQVAQELIASFLRLAIIEPLMNSIFGSMGGGMGAGMGAGMGGGGGGGLGGLLAGLFSRKGNAFGSEGVAPVSYARKGSILTGPTMFGTGDGGLTIGGEAGDEGILPLARNASGDLGVKSSGSGGTVINFNFPKGTDVEKFKKSESQLAAQAGRIAQSGNRNQ